MVKFNRVSLLPVQESGVKVLCHKKKPPRTRRGGEKGGEGWRGRGGEGASDEL